MEHKGLTSNGLIYNGIVGSEGIAIGRALVYKKDTPSIGMEHIDDADIAEELARAERALSQTAGQIRGIREETADKFGEEEAAIFDAHLLILEDPELVDGIRELISAEKLNAAHAAAVMTDRLAELFSSIEDEYLRERAADVKDVGERLVRNLMGVSVRDIGHLDEDIILIARDLTPSDTAIMDKQHVLGFATDVGGRTSHTAIMARSLEIPAVLGLGNISGTVSDNDMVVIDGIEGKVAVNPDEHTLLDYRRKKEKYGEYKKGLSSLIGLASETLDGRRVEISANIGGPSDADAVLRYGADGVGLYRTEFLYMDRDHLPGEDEQYEAYAAVAERLDGKPLIIRTLDIGGDKKLSYLPMEEEMNPFLGFRAIRLCLDRKDIFKTQLRAILRASVNKNVRIMFPMISSVDELREARKVLEEAKRELSSEGKDFDRDIQCGIMIEIPSAAMTADILIREADFFSIGTNDLCQYTLAVDRMNEKVGGLYQPYHPGVLRLIKNVIEQSHRAGKWTGMCGEMAGDPAAAVLLLGLGLDEFSMSAGSILAVKNVIRSVTMDEAEKIASHALTLETSAGIREYCEAAAADICARITERNGAYQYGDR